MVRQRRGALQGASEGRRAQRRTTMRERRNVRERRNARLQHQSARRAADGRREARGGVCERGAEGGERRVGAGEAKHAKRRSAAHCARKRGAKEAAGRRSKRAQRKGNPHLGALGRGSGDAQRVRESETPQFGGKQPQAETASVFFCFFFLSFFPPRGFKQVHTKSLSKQGYITRIPK